MLLVYNYVLLKMSTWYSKHVEESNNIWRINNIQCITLIVLYGQFMMHSQRNIKSAWVIKCSSTVLKTEKSWVFPHTWPSFCWSLLQFWFWVQSIIFRWLWQWNRVIMRDGSQFRMYIAVLYTVSEKDCTLFFIFFLGAQCVESGVSCTDCY